MFHHRLTRFHPQPVGSTQTKRAIRVTLGIDDRRGLQQLIAAVASHRSRINSWCWQLLVANALDGRNAGIGIGWNGDGGKLQPLPFRKFLAPAVLDLLVLERREPYGKSAHKTSLDRLPRLIKSILERAGFLDSGQLGLNRDALVGHIGLDD